MTTLRPSFRTGIRTGNRRGILSGFRYRGMGITYVSNYVSHGPWPMATGSLRSPLHPIPVVTSFRWRFFAHAKNLRAAKKRRSVDVRLRWRRQHCHVPGRNAPSLATLAALATNNTPALRLRCRAPCGSLPPNATRRFLDAVREPHRPRCQPPTAHARASVHRRPVVLNRLAEPSLAYWVMACCNCTPQRCCRFCTYWLSRQRKDRKP